MSYIFLIFMLVGSLCADELTFDPPEVWEGCYNPVVVDLLDPYYEDGLFWTECGGVLQADNLRVQAKQIRYRHKGEQTIEAHGAIIVEYEGRTLVGESFFFDLAHKTGYLTCARTASPPWYVGGEKILFLENGDLIVEGGYVTTNETLERRDVVLECDRICLSRNKILAASGVRFRILEMPLFKIPGLSLDLKRFGNRSPFAVKFGWGGFLGSHLSLLYRFLSWGDLQATARIDGFFGHGVGGGIETVYTPKNSCTRFFTRSYYANDIAISSPKRKDRYRFEGTYFDRIGNLTIEGIYDKVSDAQMAADYRTQDFDLQTAGRTQLQFHWQYRSFLANLFARKRVNDFQSVNEELPTLQLNVHPFEIPYTGIIFENEFSASYLSYVFSDDVLLGRDFSAGRVSARPKLYRPIDAGPLHITPRAEAIGIAYSDSPSSDAVGQVIGNFGVDAHTELAKHYGCAKHSIEPYLAYDFLTHPKIALDQSYIFTINDGYDKLNVMRFGVRNSLLVCASYGVVRPLWIDLWTNAYFGEPLTVPKGYLNMQLQPTPYLLATVNGAWNFQQGQLDFLKPRLEWTLSENAAFAIEYRHRGRYDWRKANFYNFILDVARSEQALLDSALSDRRDTLLFRTFVRLNPNWELLYEQRYGWNRERQDNYFEYQIESAWRLFDHFEMRFTYEQREADNRYAFILRLVQ